MALLLPCPLDRPPHQRLGLAQRHGATTSRSRVRSRPSWASGMEPGCNADRGSREGAEAITDDTACDQCGDACGSSELAVCRSPGCGVEFAQCARCATEYDGCCSDACQALVTDPARNIMNNESATPPVGQRRRSELVSPDEAESWEKVVGSFGRQAGVPVVGAATLQPNAVETEDDRKRGGVGRVLSNGAVASARGPLNGASNEIATGVKAEKGEKTQEEEKTKEEEPVLESYASRHSAPESSCLAGVREATTREQPGGAHMVSGHLQGGLLKLLTGLCGAKRVLDIGTFTGYSALAFAEALPMDGVVVTLESDPRAAEAAKGHFDRSSHGGKVRVVLGQAMDSIDELVNDGSPQFDVIFIDADKKRYWDYYNRVLEGPRPLLAAKGILLADNVLFHELVPLAEAAAAENPQGPVATGETVARKGGGLAPTPRRLKIAQSLDGFNKRVRDDDRVEALMLPLRDGLSVVRWRDGRYPNISGDPSTPK